MIENRYQISVIIPVYNAEQYVEKCITSVLRQTLRDFELILVDDCGTDRSMTVIEELLKREFPDGVPDWISILRNPLNLGISPSRNTGMDAAVGEYIAFIDCDDYIAEDYLKVLYRAAKRENADVALCGYRKVDPNSKQLRVVKLDCVNVETERYRIMMVWAHLYRREFLEQCHARFQNLFLEDALFTLSVAGYVERAVIIPDIGYNYVLRPGSGMNRGNGFIYHNRYIPFQEISCTLVSAKENGIRPEVYTHLEYVIVKAFAAILITYLRHCKKERAVYYADTISKSLDTVAPLCYKNPYLPVTALPALPLKARVGTYLFVKAYQHHLLRQFVWFVTRF